jgi:hypothetical protein
MKILLCVSLAFVISNSMLAATISTTLVKAYHTLERSRTLISHHDAILTGRTGTVSENGFFVEEFNPADHQLISSTKLRHSIMSLQVMDRCRVLAHGTSDYSVIDYCKDATPRSQTYAINPTIVAHAGTYIGNESFLFFEPNAGILRLQKGQRARKIASKIIFTRSINYVAGQAWFANSFNIWKVDPLSGAKQKVFKKDYEFSGMISSFGYKNAAGQNILATSAREDGKLLLIDADSAQLIEVVDIGNEPQGITKWGQCLVIAETIKKQIHFIHTDRNKKDFQVTWDAAEAGDMLKMPSEIAVDLNTQQVFLRSSYPCPLCTQTQSSLYAFSSNDMEALADCL